MTSHKAHLLNFVGIEGLGSYGGKKKGVKMSAG